MTQQKPALTVAAWSPPAFDGRIGVAGTSNGPRAVALVADDATAILVAAPVAVTDLPFLITAITGRTGARCLAQTTGTPSSGETPTLTAEMSALVAIKACDAAVPGSLEWVGGLAPSGGGAMVPVWVGRVQQVGGDRWLLVAAPAPADPDDRTTWGATLSDTIDRWSGQSTFVLDLAARVNKEARPTTLLPGPADLGRAVGHAALSAAATLPDPGCALRLAPIVESGAPLAPWRPEPRPLATKIAVTTGPVPTLQVGTARLLTVNDNPVAGHASAVDTELVMLAGALLG